ncbi:MAG: hypothetical protein AAFX78_02060 [Cyanobacteria bacterium J06638_20]
MSRLDERLEENRLQDLRRQQQETLQSSEVLFFQGFDGSNYLAQDAAGNSVELSLYRANDLALGQPLPVAIAGSRRIGL